MRKMREGEGGKQSKTGKPELILCREDGRVCLFISIDNGHMKTCGSPGVDWRYRSPKSVLLEVEGRNRHAGDIIDVARCLEKMTRFRLRDELVASDIGRGRRG